MSDDQKPRRRRPGRPPKIDVSSVPPANAERAARDQQMFVDHYQGMTYVQIAAKHGVDRNTVLQIARKYNWKKLMKEANARQFAITLQRADMMTFDMMRLLEEDLQRLKRKFGQSNEPLTASERAYLLQFQDRMWKERRLEAGKPTDTEGGHTMKVELVLPEGVTSFGVIPTTSKDVTMIEHKSDTSAGDDAISIDDIEEQLDGDTDTEI